MAGQIGEGGENFCFKNFGRPPLCSYFRLFRFYVGAAICTLVLRQGVQVSDFKVEGVIVILGQSRGFHMIIPQDKKKSLLKNLQKLQKPASHRCRPE